MVVIVDNDAAANDAVPGTSGFGRELVALCTCQVFALVTGGLTPLWIAAAVERHWVSVSGVGGIASGEFITSAGLVFLSSAFAGRISPRRRATLGAGLALIANLVSLVGGLGGLVLGRVLSGMGTGVLLGAVTSVAVRRADAQKTLARMQICVIIVLSLSVAALPRAIAQFGPAAVFVALAALAALAAVSAQLGFGDSVSVSKSGSHGTEAHLLPILAGVGLALMFVGQGAVMAYVFSIGQALGFDQATVGLVLAVCGPPSLIGPFLAQLLGERLGLFKPLLFALPLAALTPLCLLGIASPVWFGVILVVFGSLLVFGMPYAIALIARLDPAKKIASAAPAFMMVGGAMGPAVGGQLIAGGRIEKLVYGTSLCELASFAIFALIAIYYGASQRDAARLDRSVGRDATSGIAHSVEEIL